MSDVDQFRPQTPARPLWKLQEDFNAGLKQATDNNQPLMALMYTQKAIDNLVQRVEMLEKDIVNLLERLVPAEKPAAKPRAKAEEVPAEV